MRSGATITVTEVIDDNWYYGQLGSAQGMFPATYVVKIEVPDLPPPPAAQVIFIFVNLEISLLFSEYPVF